MVKILWFKILVLPPVIVFIWGFCQFSSACRANDLENLIFSITLAKVNLINPVILDKFDIKEINHEKFTNFSITNLLEVSQIKAFQNNDIIHFLIKYAKPNLVCKKISFYLDFGENNLVADFGKKTFAIHQCDASIGTTLCRKCDSSTCAQELVSGTVAQCSTIPGHLSPITTIDDGILIINDAAAKLQHMAAYLVTFDDYVTVNETLFQNHYGLLKKRPAVSMVAHVNITGHKEQLSLPFLRELSLKNLQHIERLKKKL